ncbi:MAG: hypothetical protein AAGK04_04720 [Planctomycetota bacterium]
MAAHEHVGEHDHQHGPGCGHTAIRHDDHVDYVHDGHLHHQHGGEVLEHSIPVSDANPEGCRPVPHDADHVCGPNCGHEPVPHGDHIDYLVFDAQGNARLHHPHGDHCDDHGPVEVVQQGGSSA